MAVLQSLGFKKITPQDYKDNVELNGAIIYLENDDRPFVQVSIFGNSLVDLLDSGAHLSILGIGSLNLLKSCKLQLFSSQVSVKAASGQELEVKGTVYLPVTFNEETKIIETLVVPSLQRRILLGMNFWNSFKITPTIHEVKIENVENYEKESPVPARINPFPTSPFRQQQINAELDKILNSKIIEKFYSDWALRLVPVDKPDGRVRLCLDARMMNERTIRDSYLLPHADRILSRLVQQSTLLQ